MAHPTSGRQGFDAIPVPAFMAHPTSGRQGFQPTTSIPTFPAVAATSNTQTATSTASAFLPAQPYQPFPSYTAPVPSAFPAPTGQTAVFPTFPSSATTMQLAAIGNSVPFPAAPQVTSTQQSTLQFPVTAQQQQQQPTMQTSFPSWPSAAQSSAPHTRIHCDCCRQEIGAQARYKCMYCHDFDLCAKCEHADRSTHDSSHPLIKLANADVLKGTILAANRSLLVHQGTRCVHCSASPIVGHLYQCAQCSTVHCEMCEMKEQHPMSHNRLKISFVLQKSTG
eukprot:TRINITY_DN1128_c1_g1_i1.p1 TRINITY_DN1128_c1_g1~~TRINITY_DN1128_c1_g1_i1.p1  ORF type:complete len:303 (-),score=24.59 TRINITY_DN1128_c1_g1_i1:63-902(-)